MRHPDARILTAAGLGPEELAALSLAPKRRRGDPAPMPTKKPGRGGARVGAGRKPTTGRGAGTRHAVTVAFAPDEILEIEAAAGDVPVATWVREAALLVARARKP
jgi:hypothetical protein